MGIGEHQQKTDAKAELEGSSTPLTNRDPEVCADNPEQGSSTPLTNRDPEVCADNPEQGSSTPLTNKDPEKAGDIPKQGIWQKLRSPRVPLLYVIVGAAISGTVIIILAALLSVRAPTGCDKDTACLEKLPGETPETKVVNGSSAAQCMDDWVLYRGKCYYFSDKIDTWTDSQNFCKSHNSSLAIIDNDKELNFLNLLKSNNYWIGLSRTQDDSGWVWIDGTFYSETLFNIYRKPTVPGESENVFLNGDGFKSESGRYPKKYICSKSCLDHPP